MRLSMKRLLWEGLVEGTHYTLDVGFIYIWQTQVLKS